MGIHLANPVQTVRSKTNPRYRSYKYEDGSTSYHHANQPCVAARDGNAIGLPVYSLDVEHVHQSRYITDGGFLHNAGSAVYDVCEPCTVFLSYRVVAVTDGWDQIAPGPSGEGTGRIHIPATFNPSTMSVTAIPLFIPCKPNGKGNIDVFDRVLHLPTEPADVDDKLVTIELLYRVEKVKWAWHYESTLGFYEEGSGNNKRFQH